MYDIIIIGGGAAGMCTAIKSKKKNNRVLIIEHNDKLGKKILSTGNGRCNLTNTSCKAELFDNNPEGIPPYFPYENKAFAKNVISRFDCEDTIEWFRSLGILCVNKNGYIYPLSEQASSVREALEAQIRLMGIDVIYGYQPVKVVKNKNVFVIDNEYRCKKLVLACGGSAAPASGSDGSGYELAKMLGHRIVKPRPALCGLKCTGAQFKIMQKIRSDCRLHLFVESPEHKDSNNSMNENSFLNNNRSTRLTASSAFSELTGEYRKQIMTVSGNVQFNSYGVSGIPAMQLSSVAGKLLEHGQKPELNIEFLPDLSFDEIVNFIRSRIVKLTISSKNYSSKSSYRVDLNFEDLAAESMMENPEYGPTLGSLLNGILNKKIVKVIFKEAGLDADMPLTKGLQVFKHSKQYKYGKVCAKHSERKDDLTFFAARIAGIIKHFKVEVSGLCGFEEAQVSAGGVDVSKIDPETMESKIVPGLYFAGEIVDIDGICGGYNLQWAFSTADAVSNDINVSE